MNEDKHIYIYESKTHVRKKPFKHEKNVYPGEVREKPFDYGNS